MKTHKMYRPKNDYTDEEKEFLRRESRKDLIYTILVFLLGIAMIGLIVFATYSVTAELAR